MSGRVRVSGVRDKDRPGSEYDNLRVTQLLAWEMKTSSRSQDGHRLGASCILEKWWAVTVKLLRSMHRMFTDMSGMALMSHSQSSFMEAVNGNVNCKLMKKFLIYLYAGAEVFLKWALALFIGGLCVLTPYGAPVAVGFLAVTASLHVKDPYLKVIAAAGGSIMAMWLILNAAELAIILTAWQVKKLIDRYIFHLDRSLRGESLVVPCVMPEM